MTSTDFLSSDPEAVANWITAFIVCWISLTERPAWASRTEAWATSAALNLLPWATSMREVFRSTISLRVAALIACNCLRAASNSMAEEIAPENRDCRPPNTW